ncbi:MAG: hypothetical protein SFW66_07100 [Gammaproteobacteria bacterium]|nr:hypothetical protein [Gammaproteobacteria bacterium]
MIKVSQVVSLIALTTCFIASNAFADNANLRIKVAGVGKTKYFLCTNTEGCYSLAAADHGKVFPLTPGKLQQAFLMTASNYRLYHQPLPSSCLANVNGSQTLEMTGKITTNADGSPTIKSLGCRIVG